MQALRITVGPFASASANNIALSQTPSAAGNLTLNGSTVTGGVAVLDTARFVLFTTSANETTKTFTVYGTNSAGYSISEVVQGVNNSTVSTANNFKTVTQIAVSAALAGAVTVGTAAINASDWVRLDGWSYPNVAIQLNVTGTVNYTLQSTLDDPNSPSSPTAPAAMTWVASNDKGVVGATSTQQTNFLFTPIFARVLMNSGTGSIVATFVQSGVVNK